jgi:SAM-dependent methyltransferase
VSQARDGRRVARALAAASLAEGDATGWFERLYADRALATIPWADLRPNPHLVGWAREHGVRGDGRRALKVGCGLGDDAEALEALGFSVVAFDVSATAVEWARERFPGSPVEYVVADLLDPPPAWEGAFDLVLEAYTLQVLPPELRPLAARNAPATVAPGGTLLAISRGRDPGDDPGAMPWPLTPAELRGLFEPWLESVSFEDFVDDEEPPVRRLRQALRRPGPA